MAWIPVAAAAAPSWGSKALSVLGSAVLGGATSGISGAVHHGISRSFGVDPTGSVGPGLYNTASQAQSVQARLQADAEQQEIARRDAYDQHADRMYIEQQRMANDQLYKQAMLAIQNANSQIQMQSFLNNLEAQHYRQEQSAFGAMAEMLLGRSRAQRLYDNLGTAFRDYAQDKALEALRQQLR